jgi:PAS domain-containing protein
LQEKDRKRGKSKTYQAIKERTNIDLLENYEFFFNNSSDAVFLGSPTGAVYKCNPAATALFGYTEEEFYTLGRDAICDPNDPCKFKD